MILFLSEQTDRMQVRLGESPNQLVTGDSTHKQTKRVRKKSLRESGCKAPTNGVYVQEKSTWKMEEM